MREVSCYPTVEASCHIYVVEEESVEYNKGELAVALVEHIEYAREFTESLATAVIGIEEFIV